MKDTVIYKPQQTKAQRQNISGGFLRKLLFLSVLAICLPGYAGAGVFKCAEEGKTIYQEYPCRGAGSEINVVPASDPLSPGEGGAEVQDALTANRNNQAKILTLERRLRDLDYEIRNLEADINKYQTQMDTEFDILRKKREFWKNKPGGSTWEQSIAAEMQSVSEKYKVQIQSAQDSLSQLFVEKNNIQDQLSSK